MSLLRSGVSNILYITKTFQEILDRSTRVLPSSVVDGFVGSQRLKAETFRAPIKRPRRLPPSRGNVDAGTSATAGFHPSLVIHTGDNDDALVMETRWSAGCYFRGVDYPLAVLLLRTICLERAVKGTWQIGTYEHNAIAAFKSGCSPAPILRYNKRVFNVCPRARVL